MRRRRRREEDNLVVDDDIRSSTLKGRTGSGADRTRSGNSLDRQIGRVVDGDKDDLEIQGEKGSSHQRRVARNNSKTSNSTTRGCYERRGRT